MKILSAAALALCAVTAVTAQDPKNETKHLTVATSATPEAAAPGKRVALAIDVAPKPKMHVYSPGQEGYIAITLTLDADPAFTAAKAKYPAGEKIYLPVLKETQIVYARPFRITQDLTLASTPEMRKRASDGAAVTIKGTLRYQACDDRICYLPTNMPVSWTVKLGSK